MPEQFPPHAWWYETTVAASHGVRNAEVAPLRFEERDETRFAIYQLPENPVEPGSVAVAGYLFSNAAGELVDGAGTVAGTVDFTTGMFEVDLTLSPDAGSRQVQYLPLTA